MRRNKGGRTVTAVGMLLLLSAASLFIAGGTGAAADPATGWVQQTSGVSDNLYDVSIVDASIAWAVGKSKPGVYPEYGVLLKTVDGGATWASAAWGEAAEVRSVSAVSADIAWAAVGAANRGRIYKTNDGGASWALQDTGTADIDFVEAFSADVAWAATKNYPGPTTILRTVDGGANWTTVDLGGSGVSSGGFDAVDEDTAWVLGGSTELGALTLVTTDGGATWASHPLPYPEMQNISAAGSEVAWATASSKTMKTADGGVSWQTSNLDGYFYFAAIDADTAWAWQNYSTVIARTVDGDTWFSQDGATDSVDDICALDADTALAVGSSGMILKTSDGGGAQQPPAIAAITPSAAMPGQLVKIEGSHFGFGQYDSSLLLGTVPPGNVMSWSDTTITCVVPSIPTGTVNVTVTVSGMTSAPLPLAIQAPSEKGWVWETSGSTANLNAVTAPDADTAWAVGAGGTILKTSDAGATWAAQSSGVTYDLMDVSAADAQTAYAVTNYYDAGNHPVFLKTSNGGGAWSQLALDIAVVDSLVSVSAVDADNVWICGAKSYKPVVLRSVNGGSTWQSFSPGYYAGRIAAADAATAWVVGATGSMDMSAGSVVHTGNAGASWEVQSAGLTGWNDVSPVNAQTVWIAGGTYRYNPPINEGECYLSTNGGASWTDLTLPTKNYLRRVAAVDAQTAWVTESSYGRIWRTVNGGGAWSKQLDILESVRDIDAVNADVAWAVGSNGLILHTSGGGLRPAPTVASVTPSQGSQLSMWLDITVEGAGFESGATVRLQKGAVASAAANVKVLSETQLTCSVFLFGFEPGAYDVVVVNPDGQEARLSAGFSVTNPCGQGASVSVLAFGLMMGLLALGGSGFLRRRPGRKRHS